MDGENRVNLPDDLEQVLRRTMAVEPSPAFLPHVRERIANETRPWRWSWHMVAGAGAAGAIVVALTLSGADDRTQWPPVPQAPVVRTAAPAPAVVETPAELRVERAPARRPVRVAVLEQRPPRTDDMPAVIVDERQRTALRALIEMVGRGQLTEEAFAQTVPPSLQPIEERVTEIAVAPLAVSPIAVDGVLQVGHEEKPPRPAEAGVSRP